VIAAADGCSDGGIGHSIGIRGDVQSELKIGVVGSSSHTSRDALRANGTLDAITRVPVVRWCLDTPDESQVQARFGSFVADVDMFDSDLFNISSIEGILLDPQQRMLLEAAWEAKAGLQSCVPADRLGVTVGISNNEYGRMADVVSAYTATGAALSVACGRMSYTFGMQGICLSVDTACSSSLVGSHIAISSIRSGECDSVTACGVNVTLDALTSEMFIMAGMLSKDGRCKTLDASADGYVRGEACVVLELRTLTGTDAPIMAAVDSGTLVASAVNQDGRSSSLTAPNGPSQQRAIRSTLSAAGMDPSALDGLELHGTGTSLGDPIEVGALHAVLVESTQATRLAPLILSAMKSCMGHTEPAAGAVGLLHAMLEAAAHSAQPIVHLNAINPHLASVTRMRTTGAMDSMALPRQHMAAATIPVNRPAQRGISSFAFQGTNAHVMVAASASTATTGMTQRGSAALWTRERLWLAAPRHPLVQSVAVITASVTVRFEARISVDHQMYLWDHRVAGRGLHTAATILEIGTSALRLIHDAPAAMCGTAITSPFVLPSADASTRMICSVNMLSGGLEIGSSANNHPHLTSHCRTIHARQSVMAIVSLNEGLRMMLHASQVISTPPTALGRIIHDAAVVGGGNSGLYMPTAVLDANLSLASAVQDVPAASKLHIPAGIDAYWVEATKVGGQSGVWATATSRPKSTSDHTIFGNGSRVIYLAGLEIKPAGTSSRAAPKVRTALGSKLTTGVMHEKAWVTCPDDIALIRAQVLKTITDFLDDGGDRAAAGQTVIDGSLGLIEAGLESLGVMELHAALQRAFSGIALPSSLMYDCPTVDDVVHLVTSTVAAMSANYQKPHRRSLGTDALPHRALTRGDTVDIRAMPRDFAAASTLTREQHLFWTHSLIFPSSSVYNMGFVLQFDEPEVDQVGVASDCTPLPLRPCLQYFTPPLDCFSSLLVHNIILPIITPIHP